MLFFTVIFYFYILTYILFFLTFIVLVFNLSNIKYLNPLITSPRIQQLYYIFIIALILRLLFLFQDDIVTTDLSKYVARSEWFLAGQVPYQDFVVNKPPMYIYMLYGMGRAFGAGEMQFRMFFSVIDALLAVLVFYLCLERYNSDFSFKAAFAYAICPLPLVMIGFWGHYEPIVMVFVLLAFIFLFRNNYYLSALALGTAFAFKFFPIVLLPFLAWTAKSWNQRILYFVLFAVPMAISLIPIMLISPDAFYSYLYEQTVNWPAKKSFAYIYETIAGTQTFAGIKASLAAFIFFAALLFIMFINWVWKEFRFNFWFKIIILFLIIYYGTFTMASFKSYQSDLSLIDPALIMVGFALVYFTISIFLFNKFIRYIEFKIGPEEELFVLTIFSFQFLLFASSQYNPWYLLWHLPFLLATKNEDIRFILFMLLFWNLGGFGISLLPGLVLA
jgi:hypothetical protein